ERGEEGNAHQDARSDPREEGAGKPARRNLAPIGRTAMAIRDQRWLIAEVGYGLIHILHSLRWLFPGAGLIARPSICLDFCLWQRTKSTNRTVGAFPHEDTLRGAAG